MNQSGQISSVLLLVALLLMPLQGAEVTVDLSGVSLPDKVSAIEIKMHADLERAESEHAERVEGIRDEAIRDIERIRSRERDPLVSLAIQAKIDQISGKSVPQVGSSANLIAAGSESSKVDGGFVSVPSVAFGRVVEAINGNQHDQLYSSLNGPVHEVLATGGAKAVQFEVKKGQKIACVADPSGFTKSDVRGQPIRWQGNGHGGDPRKTHALAWMCGADGGKVFEVPFIEVKQDGMLAVWVYVHPHNTGTASGSLKFKLVVAEE